MPESITPHENLEHIFNGILSLNQDGQNISQGKRQLDTKRPYPDIWVNNVSEDTSDEATNGEEASSEDVGSASDDDTPETYYPIEPEIAAQEMVDDELCHKIALWLHSIQAHGFSPVILQKYMAAEINDEEEDDTWWEEGVVRVFQPYYDIEKDDIDEVSQGRTDKDTGDPIGKCIVLLKNGDELDGTFIKGRLLQGMASLEGTNMEKYGLLSVRGFHKNGVLHGQGRAVIAPHAIWSHIKCDIVLEGIFNDGYLEGPVRGVDHEGNLIFVGFYKKGLPTGNCYVAKEGQGWLYGEVDKKGRFSGTDVAYLYPNLYTAIHGSFNEEILVEGRATFVEKAQIDAHTDILNLTFSCIAPDCPAYTFCPSDASNIFCDWQLMDNYERVTVRCKKSNIDGAGDGLFAAKDLPNGMIISYYNGLKIQAEEDYRPDNYNYQIYVDWTNTDGSAYVDIPNICIEYENYRASLAHKANHSFSPNCKFIAVDHPRFGRIPALKTIKPVNEGDELFSHYKYDMAVGPTWYIEAWQRAQSDTNAA